MESAAVILRVTTLSVVALGKTRPLIRSRPTVPVVCITSGVPTPRTSNSQGSRAKAEVAVDHCASR